MQRAVSLYFHRLHSQSHGLGFRRSFYGQSRPFSAESAQVQVQVQEQQKGTDFENLVASVVFERPPIVIPKLNPEVAAFREYTFHTETRKRLYYQSSILKKLPSVERDVKRLKYIPTAKLTEADKSGDKKSLQRALDRRLYLIVHGTPSGFPEKETVWHFPEKMYGNEETMRKCAESALESAIEDYSNIYFVGNAPCGYTELKIARSGNDISTLKRFYFKSQVVGKKSYKVRKYKDYLWVTKDELLERVSDDERLYLDIILLQ